MDSELINYLSENSASTETWRVLGIGYKFFAAYSADIDALVKAPIICDYMRPYSACNIQSRGENTPFVFAPWITYNISDIIIDYFISYRIEVNELLIQSVRGVEFGYVQVYRVIRAVDSSDLV